MAPKETVAALVNKENSFGIVSGSGFCIYVHGMVYFVRASRNEVELLHWQPYLR